MKLETFIENFVLSLVSFLYLHYLYRKKYYNKFITEVIGLIFLASTSLLIIRILVFISWYFVVKK